MTSGQVRIGAATKKGFRRDQFVEAWERYAAPVPPLLKRNIETSHGRRGFQPFSKRNTRGGCFAFEKRYSPRLARVVSMFRFLNPANCTDLTICLYCH
ncbi:hypothetical protein ACFS3C_08210 [Azotobacter vinelandii]